MFGAIYFGQYHWLVTVTARRWPLITDSDRWPLITTATRWH